MKRKGMNLPWGQIIAITIFALVIVLFAYGIAMLFNSEQKQNEQQQQQNHNNEMFIDQCVAAGKHVTSVNTGSYPNVQSYLVCQ